jgi:hypothetical protein
VTAVSDTNQCHTSTNNDGSDPSSWFLEQNEGCIMHFWYVVNSAREHDIDKFENCLPTSWRGSYERTNMAMYGRMGSH